MIFKDLKVRFAVIWDCPESIVIVRERGKEDTQEETCRCILLD